MAPSAPSRKFGALKIDTLPSTYLQADHLSPALSPGVGGGSTSSRRPSDDVRRRSPLASPALLSGEKGPHDYFARVVSPSPNTLSRQNKSTSRITRFASRVPIPPVIRRWLTNPIVIAISALCLLALVYRNTMSGISTHGGRGTGVMDGGVTTPTKAPIAAGQLVDLPPLPEEYSSHFPTLSLPLSLRDVTLNSLPSRLMDFLERPIRTHAEASHDMEERCPTDVADRLVNPDQHAGNLDFWKSVSREDIIARRAGIVNALAGVLERGEPLLGTKVVGGRGIVLTGGNSDTTLRTITLLKHLSQLGNDLPIEVFHYPGELTNGDHRREIQALGATLKEVYGVSKAPGAWKNFQIKGLALIQSSFREIIYMDSDNIPLRPLSHLFSSPHYLSTGAVFWPDLNKDHPHNAIWRVIGDTCSFDQWSFESGQMVIDKAGNGGLNLAALWIAAHMMSTGGGAGGDEREWWFHMCGGDKDTYRWAFRVLGIPWSDSPRWMSLVGFENSYDGGRFCGHTTLQYDLDIPHGSERELPLFVHSNLLKHILPHGLGPSNTFTHIRRFKNDAYDNPSLNFAHGWVYNNNFRGMCLDFEWGPLATQRVSPESREDGIVTLSLDDIEGQPFEGFTKAFFDEGGRVGGW